MRRLARFTLPFQEGQRQLDFRLSEVLDKPDVDTFFRCEKLVIFLGEVQRRTRIKSGGILFDWPAHLIDQALQLVPAQVQSVYCRSLTPSAPGSSACGEAPWPSPTSLGVRCPQAIQDRLCTTDSQPRPVRQHQAP